MASGLFWVLEQIPGYTQRNDLTKVLETRTFWPSYNSPYFPGSLWSNYIIKLKMIDPEVFNKSGNLELVAKYGDWFTYDKTPRALIFAR